MNLPKVDLLNETAIRQERNCRGCGQAKENGMVVCWDCFKRGSNPFKYFDGSLADWLNQKQLAK